MVQWTQDHFCSSVNIGIITVVTPVSQPLLFFSSVDRVDATVVQLCPLSLTFHALYCSFNQLTVLVRLLFSCFVGFRLNGELVVDMERCFRKAANDMWFVNTRECRMRGRGVTVRSILGLGGRL